MANLLWTLVNALIAAWVAGHEGTNLIGGLIV
jgi:hypothetical protein